MGRSESVYLVVGVRVKRNLRVLLAKYFPDSEATTAHRIYAGSTIAIPGTPYTIENYEYYEKDMGTFIQLIVKEAYVTHFRDAAPIKVEMPNSSEITDFKNFLAEVGIFDEVETYLVVTGS